MSDYSFTTYWKFNAPLQKVWNEINNPLQWPFWWKGVIVVTELQPGDEWGLGSVKRSTWKSKLPYKLTFDSRVTAVEPMKRIEGLAFGDLDGKGVWTFTIENNLTIARYEWEVKTNKWWMNLLAPIARPVFEWNHDVIMAWGGEGLAKRLECSLIK